MDNIARAITSDRLSSGELDDARVWSRHLPFNDLMILPSFLPLRRMIVPTTQRRGKTRKVEAQASVALRPEWRFR